MTKAKFPRPAQWLNIHLCKVIYENFKGIKLGEPLPPFNQRYPGVLESILGSVKLRGNLLKLTIDQVATLYFVHLVKSQAFLNGNKRMAVILTDLFLYLNGYWLNLKLEDLTNISISISEDHSHKIDEITLLLEPIFENSIFSLPKTWS